MSALVPERIVAEVVDDLNRARLTRLRVIAGDEVPLRDAPDEALVEAWLRSQAARNLSPATVRRRARSTRSFRAFLAPAGLRDATADDIVEWLLTLRAARTRHSYCSDLRTLYAWLVRRKVMAEAPTEAVDSPQQPRSLPRPLEAGQIQAAVIATPDPLTRVAILLGAYAGLRISEIANMRHEDVDTNANPPVLVVRHGKGGRDRVLPLHPALKAALSGMEPGWLFPSTTRPGQPVRSGSIGRRIRSAFAAIGVPMTPHQLRHSYGTAIAQATSGDMLTVMALMGHASLETSRGYVRWSNRGHAEVVARLYEVEPG